MASQRDNNVPTIEKYNTGLFYGAGPEAPTQRTHHTYGATYANGQARPTFAPQVQGAPAAVRPVAAVAQSLPANVRNGNFSRDQIVLSQETRELNEGAAWATVAPTQRAQTGAGDSAGPAYSNDFRNALDALLNGLGSPV